MQIVLATSNPGKVIELQAQLADLDVQIRAQNEYAIPDAVEDGLTFVENAIKKARHASLLTGLPALADDSGLAVDALGGAPGIYSARYAQRHGAGAGDAANIELLLAELQRGAYRTAAERTARFRCALVFMRHPEDPAPIIAEGVWHGVIAEKAAGSNGFGYDPIFYLEREHCTAAQLDATKKATLSHRGNAVRLLKRLLEEAHVGASTV